LQTYNKILNQSINSTFFIDYYFFDTKMKIKNSRNHNKSELRSFYKKTKIMTNSTRIFLSILVVILLNACNKEDKKTDNSQQITQKVYYQEINDTIFVSDISKIIEIDLNDDRNIDIAFEIVNLNIYNEGNSMDSLAARAITPRVAIMDNSTYGYPDALEKDVLLNTSMSWIKRENSVLGTNPSAFFQGKGEKYLGFRLIKQNDYYYGWVKLECSEKRDTLRIISCGISEEVNNSIYTGQKE